MRFINTLGNLQGSAFTAALDAYASEEYRAGRVGTASPPQWGQDVAYGELWLMAVARPTAESTEWVVYAITSEEDIPGWPARTGEYTGGIRTAVDIAQPLADAGHTVALRHYAEFSVDLTAADVSLA